MFGSALDFEHPFGTMASVSRTRVRRRRLAVATMAIAVGAVLAGPVGHAWGARPPVPVAAHRYVVCPGDTAWSIAQHVARGEDPRAVVDEILRANRVDPGALIPGQTLLIPAGL